MATVSVRLAECPTDVLVWLAQRPAQSFTTDEIAAAIAPEGATTPRASTNHALHLLQVGGYVVRRVEDLRWEVTAEGRAAVVEAMTPADRGSSRDARRASL